MLKCTPVIFLLLFVLNANGQEDVIKKPDLPDFLEPQKFDLHNSHTHNPYNKSPLQNNNPNPQPNTGNQNTARMIEENLYKELDEQTGIYNERPYLTKQQNLEAQKRFYNKMYGLPQDNDKQNSFQRQQTQQDQVMTLINEAEAENKKQGKYYTPLSYYSSPEFLEETQPFEDAYNRLNDMLTGKTTLSVKDAYLSIELAFGGSYLSEKEYNEQIKKSTDFILQWLIQNNKDHTKNEELNYGIQKFMKDTLKIAVPQPENRKQKFIQHVPFIYDYEDFQAEKDHRNYFLTKCLATGTGQCNSMPATYMVLAEQLGAKAYLAFAPQHSFIKYPDDQGDIHAYEPTSHCAISDKQYVEIIGITPKAIKSGIYLYPLNKKEVVANCMYDLAATYLKKHGSADGKFIIKCINTADKYYTNKANLTSYFLISSLLARDIDHLLKVTAPKNAEEIKNNPDIKKLYGLLNTNEEKIKQLGYQKMTDEMYLHLMQQHEYKNKIQQQKNIDTKQKRNLFHYSIN